MISKDAHISCAISRAAAWVVILMFLVTAAWTAFGLGKDYRNEEPVHGPKSWPSGMEHLVNATNRIHGFWINGTDIFFFSGATAEFNNFLHDYSQIPDVKGYSLVIHEGKGEAKSPWASSGLPCEWKLEACPKGMQNVRLLLKQGERSTETLQKAGKEEGYFMAVHLWTGGQVDFQKITIPKNVEVKEEN
jgi:hypothetical protein